MGQQVHSIEDYVGAMAGMPPAVTEFEDEIDAIAGSAHWIRLSTQAIDWLEAEGFDFRSPEAGALLSRAAGNPATQGDALGRLLELGALAESESTEEGTNELLQSALKNRHTGLAQALIDEGALNVAGRLDSSRVDAAFQSAIVGGRLAAVKTVWNATAASHPPSLTFDDPGEDGDSTSRTAPVTLLLDPPYRDTDWEGLEIAQWLAEKGCDLHAHGADGRTLLHIAAESDDTELVCYLLDEGLDASAPGAYGLPALGSARNEDIAMLLLEAGTDVDALSEFREYAEGNHWGRVVRWLDASK
jgi:hypothetical protein